MSKSAKISIRKDGEVYPIAGGSGGSSGPSSISDVTGLQAALDAHTSGISSNATNLAAKPSFLVLGPVTAVPNGTAVGTLIFRTST